MSMTEKKYNWYAVYTRPRWEKKIAGILDAKGITYYCPLNKVNKKWSDRRKVVLEPLFKGYIFVYIDEQHKWDIKKIDGILNYVYWLGKPAVIVENDIDTIRKFLQEFDDVNVVDVNLAADDKVIIKQGVLMDYEGIVVEVSGNTAKVKIQGLGVELSAVFKKDNLQQVNKIL